MSGRLGSRRRGNSGVRAHAAALYNPFSFSASALGSSVFVKPFCTSRPIPAWRSRRGSLKGRERLDSPAGLCLTAGSTRTLPLLSPAPSIFRISRLPVMRRFGRAGQPVFVRRRSHSRNRPCSSDIFQFGGSVERQRLAGFGFGLGWAVRPLNCSGLSATRFVS